MAVLNKYSSTPNSVVNTTLWTLGFSSADPFYASVSVFAQRLAAGPVERLARWVVEAGVQDHRLGRAVASVLEQPPPSSTGKLFRRSGIKFVLNCEGL